ncbi:hypothetical protein BDP27DRAFT_1362492 [Rhodocollybia butyracea]|uniref:Uncharacterized protein n=1 Tax=Rhodocollybia butyracea TaxID=206335 RepID=A0A9P5PY60_9AGAR|nr:hypothetical protein BDP27DRAFT_1362492 [Rhodocollybia butyracea]
MLPSHIRCFVLVFSVVLISAVHALPAPSAAIEPIAPRSPIVPGSVAPGSPSRSTGGPHPIVPDSRSQSEAGLSWNKAHWSLPYRATILDLTKFPVIWDETNPPEFIPVAHQVKYWVGLTISTVVGTTADGKTYYSNPKKPSTKKLSAKDSGPKMAVFVYETRGLANDVTKICSGEWPCIGLRVSVRPKQAYYAIYDIKPNVALEELKHAGYLNKESKKEWNEYDIEFWNLFPREEFQRKWPKLKEAIDRRHQEHKSKVTKQKIRNTRESRIRKNGRMALEPNAQAAQVQEMEDRSNPGPGRGSERGSPESNEGKGKQPEASSSGKGRMALSSIMS